MEGTHDRKEEDEDAWIERQLLMSEHTTMIKEEGDGVWKDMARLALPSASSSSSFHKVATEVELFLVKEMLREQLPSSAMSFQMVSSFPFSTFEHVLVDSMDAPRHVLIVYKWARMPTMVRWNCFGPDPDVLKQMVVAFEPALFPKQTHSSSSSSGGGEATPPLILLEAFQPHARDAIIEVICALTGKSLLFRDDCGMFYYGDTELPLDPEPFTGELEGFTLDVLKEGDIEAINEAWPFKAEGSRRFLLFLTFSFSLSQQPGRVHDPREAQRLCEDA